MAYSDFKKVYLNNKNHSVKTKRALKDVITLMKKLSHVCIYT